MLRVDLLDFFRGARPWPQLYRFLNRLPGHGHYKSALAMDPKLGAELAKQPIPDDPPPPTPLGYTFEVYQMMRLIDLTKELLRIIPASFSGKLPPPMPPEPRPMTAADRIRDEQETRNLQAAVALILGK